MTRSKTSSGVTGNLRRTDNLVDVNKFCFIYACYSQVLKGTSGPQSKRQRGEERRNKNSLMIEEETYDLRRESSEKSKTQITKYCPGGLGVVKLED